LVYVKVVSGSASPNKRCLFTCGVVRPVKNQLLSIFGYQEGKLPVKNLRVSLFSSILKKADCVARVSKEDCFQG
jgi:hypothetical protein